MDVWADIEAFDGREMGEMIIFSCGSEGKSYYSPPLTDIYLHPMEGISVYLNTIENERAYDRAMGVL